jgi:predicted enzyme related to lactoylglutathione lyase
MRAAASKRIVHLELRTGNLPRACAFYTSLLGWRAEGVEVGARSYLGARIGGGVVEHDAAGALWLPYVEVDDVAATTGQARRIGAAVVLELREGPVGWRSVVAAPAGAEIAFWQPKP